MVVQKENEFGQKKKKIVFVFAVLNPRGLTIKGGDLKSDSTIFEGFGRADSFES